MSGPLRGRRLQPLDRGLAGDGQSACRARPRCPRDGHLESPLGRSRRSRPPLRSRCPVPLHPLHQTTGRSRGGQLGRVTRRQLRQRPGRDGQWAVQGRVDQPPRALAIGRRGRTGDRPVGPLPEHPPPAWCLRRHPAGRVRGSLPISARRPSWPPESNQFGLHETQYGSSSVGRSSSRPAHSIRPTFSSTFSSLQASVPTRPLPLATPGPSPAPPLDSSAAHCASGWTTRPASTSSEPRGTSPDSTMQRCNRHDQRSAADGALADSPDHLRPKLTLTATGLNAAAGAMPRRSRATLR